MKGRIYPGFLIRIPFCSAMTLRVAFPGIMAFIYLVCENVSKRHQHYSKNLGIVLHDPILCNQHFRF
eukprot:UN27891